MITFDDVTITYAGASEPVLRNVDFTIPAGELCVVVGPTGAGKSTLLGAVNGLVPHFTGGELRGRVTADGRDTRTHPPRELADVVGVVSQDPIAGCVTDSVEEELAYCMEQLAIPPAVMRKRVEEVLDVLGLAPLRSRALSQLSGGEIQRCAIGAALTAHPQILVLDEPTSALDPVGAEDVLAAIMRLVHDLGVTVVMAEHRLERVVQYADAFVYVAGDGSVQYGSPAEIMARTRVAPPVVELGRAAQWNPLPLSIRDARRAAHDLRENLDGVVPPVAVEPGRNGHTALTASSIVVQYGATVAVRGVDVELRTGEIVALMGRNGSGKSSLLWALQGTGTRTGGRVAVQGSDPATLSPADARTLVGLVPQSAADLLYLDTVADELAQADRESGAVEGSARALLDTLIAGIDDDKHPRDLSEGQRLALVLAIQLTAMPAVVFLDEPTRGLDYEAKQHLAHVLRDLAAAGKAIVVATHDVEFAALAVHRVIVVAEGEIVADGAAADVLVASPSFAPQVAKILAPLPWLTVGQLVEAGALEKATS
ncbi:MAG TPA: ATP-binding cassette domain-containing protein [Acidimicrobiia bacterium]|nr:ATP-binding cassette domain-containing protein [Acidimicrobiia bacterium]